MENQDTEIETVLPATFKVGPRDKRCRSWCKVLDVSNLPMPSQVDGANDLPGKYLNPGSIEVFPGEYVFEGEARHHVKARGWDYWLHVRGADGEIEEIKIGAHTKAVIKDLLRSGRMDRGFGVELLKGAGDVAAAVRAAHLHAWELTHPAIEAPASGEASGEPTPEEVAAAIEDGRAAIEDGRAAEAES